MIAEYGQDFVGACWRGETSVFLLGAMVEHLPPTSALHRALNGPWQQHHYQLADVYDSLAVLIEDGRTLHTDGHTWQQPVPASRPGPAAAGADVPQLRKHVVPRAAPGVKSLAEQIAIATGEGV